MEMNEEIFSDEKMEVDCDNLAQNWLGPDFDDMPKLGHNLGI